MEENREYIETMKKIATIFNENNIKYALVGGIVAELRASNIRKHKDIDFAIFDEDWSKIQSILYENGIFCDSHLIDGRKLNNWADTTEHNNVAKDKSTNIDIGFFMYSHEQERFDDFGEIITEQGFCRKSIINYNGKKVTLRERLENLEDYLFSDECYETIDGVKIKTQPLPYIVMLKAKNIRGKDRTDLVNTLQLLTEEEIDNYNKHKGSISSIYTTAQLGDNAKEGKCEEVKKLLDTYIDYDEY